MNAWRALESPAVTPGVIALVLLCFCAATAGAAPGGKDVSTVDSSLEPRQRTLAVLEGIQPTGGPSLRAWINDGLGRQVELGDSLVFNFESDADGYLTAIYLDSDGGAIVLYPTGDLASNRMLAGVGLSFPGSGTDGVTAGMPLGTESIFALWTRERISLSELGELSPGEELLVVGPNDATALARRLAAKVSSLPAGAAAISRVDQDVVAELSEQTTQHTARGIVTHFTKLTRSIERPTLDLNIKFAFGSATLTESARLDLDEVGRALRDPRLESRRFVLSGHTDDVGNAAYNLELSTRRADAARSYLINEFAIEPGRLESNGFGESSPAVAQTTEWAREQNRRVVLELVRAETER